MKPEYISRPEIIIKLYTWWKKPHNIASTLDSVRLLTFYSKL